MTLSRVAVLTAPRTIAIQHFTIPEIGDDEILVKVEGCGICGTDVHEYKNDPFGLAPVILGHEGTGEIVKLGANIRIDSAGKSVQCGDRIVSSILTCGECPACRQQPGKGNLCENLGLYGLLPDDDYYRLNGWFAEYVVLRPRSTFFVVNDLSLDLRLLIEPAAVVIHSLERAKSTGLLTFNSQVLVQGCGPIGLLQIAVLRTMGIENIIALDTNPKRLAFASNMGANQTLNVNDYPTEETLRKKLLTLTAGIGVDFAFQCTGAPQAAAAIWKFIRRGGGLCEVGFFVNNGEYSINPHLDLCNKEVNAVGSWAYSLQDYPITLNFIRSAKRIGLPLESLVTHRFSLDRLAEAMEVNIRQEGIKIVYIAQ
ncbi:alcohol dehydrogenase catalytic domain-containing protein [Salmonella enterica]|nr:theronine dehydrogenase [Salmonella enterica]EHF2309380.1 alcohol dehydrogenase catalytic domain-containing protein [Salmonella enterica subsp. enterica serovar Chester]EIR7396149.1 alcohol dehydrogenase catalytic domain-containing protein [Salmonella enterica subsp. enterica serovar Kingston]EHA3091283.1 alcohol dehydrogenase catalytic domain-containing protein [Salmonella enterica]EHA3954810.1 alcohol dehydrogenase catalytic domain-containing protein [Salmonella enterica]